MARTSATAAADGPPAFSIGDLVWHRTDSTKCGVVTGLILRTAYTYFVTWRNEGECEHQGCELTTDREHAQTPPSDD